MSRPIGRIDYLGTNGSIGESIEYDDAEKFKAKIRYENRYGTPMQLVPFRDEHGKTIDQSFLLSLDLPNVSVSVEEYRNIKTERTDDMNDWQRAEQTAKIYKEKYPVGTRIELIQMGDDPRPVPPGTRGTVAYVDDMGQIGMNWDNGRSLALIPGEDSFRVLNQEEIASEKNAASFETVGPTLT